MKTKQNSTETEPGTAHRDFKNIASILGEPIPTTHLPTHLSPRIAPIAVSANCNPLRAFCRVFAYEHGDDAENLKQKNVSVSFNPHLRVIFRMTFYIQYLKNQMNAVCKKLFCFVCE